MAGAGAGVAVAGTVSAAIVPAANITVPVMRAAVLRFMCCLPCPWKGLRGDRLLVETRESTSII
ncbi:hypothetical protein GCM10010470_61710 [Saccharopolyspora taberi]|uniref:Secreted protein n=1 Tax=Saccharopolyspora taberi TaxID=60895 RepID=A0ABN3VMK3_9PSEU